MAQSVEDMRQMLTVLASKLVTIPEAVTVESAESESGIVLKLRVAPSDVGTVIGLRGQTARSLRTILGAFGAKANCHYILEIVNEERIALIAGSE